MPSAISQTEAVGVLTSRDCEKRMRLIRGARKPYRRNINDREVMAMITPALGIFLLGLGVLGLAVATAIHDTWRLRRETKKTADHQESLREAA